MISVVIPSRNGRELLLSNLPSVLEDNPDGETIVVDDCSEDGTTGFLRSEFDAVKTLTRTGDPAFCDAVNLGMSVAEGDLLLLLNNDVRPEHGAIAELERAMADLPPSVFALMPRIRRPDGTDESRCVWSVRRGLAVTSMNGRGYIYPSGACALFRRSAWRKLGGLSKAYSPIYWEDVDLGARAAKLGLSVRRAEEAEVLHDHAATMGMSLESRSLRERNRFIFMDRNCADPPTRLSRMLWLPIHLTAALIQGNRAFINGYWSYRRDRRGGRIRENTL